MRSILVLIAVVVLWPASLVAAAEQPRQQKSDKSITAGRQHQPKRARTDQTCAVYGEGFVRVDGTQTCVKIGGSVSIGVGGSR